MAISENDVREAKSRTMRAMADQGFAGVTEDDLSYITADVLEEIELAKAKRSGCSPSADADKAALKLADDEPYPCWIGHSPVFVSGNEWSYQNNNTDDGCDRAEHLCGSGQRWKAPFAKIQKDRYCANGKKGMLGWPPA